MQYEFLEILRCPVSKARLRFELISEFTKAYDNKVIVEIKEGLLFSETGFVFPVIDGIPRLLVESMFDYSDFLEKKLPEFNELRNELETKHADLLQYCIRKNKKSKASFAFEWSFLKPEKNDKLWHDDSSQLTNVFLNETGEGQEYFAKKIVADIGSGHGLMTSTIANISNLCIGAEISKAVELAYVRNKNSNAWYAQADLQFLPFEESSFDLLYSSGVIHHTNDTEKSLSLIETIIKEDGKICLWLYHPQKNALHQLMMLLRKFTRRLPLKIAFVFLLLFIFPFTFLIKKIKNRNAPNFREEMIDLLDGFTPEFRFEIPHDVAKQWLEKRKYAAITVTTESQYGFSITGIKKK
ncbi:MAG: methyltransferase domain-containing protein [Chitinophagaceae bacterium]